MSLKKITFICAYLLSNYFAHAEQSCAVVLSSQVETKIEGGHQSSIFNKISLDEEYLAAKSNKQVGYQHQVTTFINRAFFPLIEQLAKAVTEMNRLKINEETQKFRMNFPVVHGTYRRVTGTTVINSNKVDNTILSLINNAYNSYFEVYPKHIYTSKEEFQNQNKLHQNLLALSPNIERTKKIGKLHGWFSTTITPVGDYGLKFTEDLMITTQILSEIATQSLAEASKNAALAASHLILEETARGKMAIYEGIDQDLAPLSSLVEGILSFHQLLVLTLSEKVPGLETGTDALRAFIFNGKSEQGMTSAIVKRIPLAVVGPMANAGVTFKKSFILTPNGKLDISQHLQDVLTKHQERAGKSTHPRRVCPMSLLFQGKNPFAHKSADSDFSKTGLQNLAEIYWKIYEVVSTTQYK